MVKFCKICFLCLIMLMVGAALMGGDETAEKNNKASDTGGKFRSDGADPIKEMTDIYDIKPPTLFGVNPTWLRYAGIIFSVILILILLFLVYQYWKKRQVRIETPTPSLSAEEKAYSLLGDLKGLMNSEGKEYYFRLSAVFRGYIQDRFGIEALEMTTQELLPNIKRLKIVEQMKLDSRSFVESSDPVKFAAMAVDPEQMKTHYRFVRNFIEKTTPLPTVMGERHVDRSKG
jgi:hypothetical protein